MAFTWKSHLKTAILFCAVTFFVTGVLYPLMITAIAQIFFPYNANGSLIMRGEQLIGSELIGQHFTADKYFWGRPSATKPFPYNPLNSGGTNLGPGNPAYSALVLDRINKLFFDGADETHSIPVDLYTFSGSGLDPDISLLSALYQVPRVAVARKIDPKRLNELVFASISKDIMPTQETIRVNVLRLNLALDNLTF